MDELSPLPGRPKSSLPPTASRRAADQAPTWEVGRTGLAAVASPAFTILL